MDTLAVLLDNHRVSNEGMREEISVLLQEADDARGALVRSTRVDSARAFEKTDLAIQLNDLQFKVAAAAKRAAAVEAEANQVCGREVELSTGGN